MHLCPRCAAENAIVNQCGCDPNNMPTILPAECRACAGTIALLRNEMEMMRSALQDLYDWTTMPGGQMYRERRDVYLQGGTAIRAAAQRALGLGTGRSDHNSQAV